MQFATAEYKQLATTWVEAPIAKRRAIGELHSSVQTQIERSTVEICVYTLDDSFLQRSANHATATPPIRRLVDAGSLVSPCVKVSLGKILNPNASIEVRVCVNVNWKCSSIVKSCVIGWMRLVAESTLSALNWVEGCFISTSPFTIHQSVWEWLQVSPSWTRRQVASH